MKKFSALLLVLTLNFSVATVGCAAWFESLTADPIGTLQRTFGYISNALGMARGAFTVFEGVAPDAAAQIKPTFTALEMRVREGLDTAMSAIKIAADLHQPAPDPAKTMQDVFTTLHDLETFIAGIMTGANGRAASPQLQNAVHALQQAQELH